MQCEEISSHLADHLSGSLGEAARRELAAHIADCPACREELHQASHVWQALGAIPAERPDFRTMRARLDRALAAHTQVNPSRARPTLRRIGWRPLQVPAHALLQASAALLLVALGIVLGRELLPAPAASPDLRELSQEVRDLRQMVALSLLQEPSASERLRGVSWSNQLERPGDKVVSALIETLMQDPDVNVRLASIDALKRFTAREVVRSAAIHALDTQRSPLVQMALIDFCVETQEHTALGALRRLSQDASTNEAVRARATWAIDHLEMT
jgi:hypothetical protein